MTNIKKKNKYVNKMIKKKSIGVPFDILLNL